MRTIWKFQLNAGGSNEDVTMPKGALPLTVQVQNGAVCLWARVDSDASLVRRRICIRGTGHPIPEDTTYIGSYQLFGGGFVGHVFDGGEDL